MAFANKIASEADFATSAPKSRKVRCVLEESVLRPLRHLSRLGSIEIESEAANCYMQMGASHSGSVAVIIHCHLERHTTFSYA